MKVYNSKEEICRSVQDIRQALLSRPENANRQEELSLLIDWRLAYERHMNRGGMAALRAFEESMGDEKSPSLRALSLLANRAGVNHVYRTTVSLTDRFMEAVYGTAPEEQICFDLERLKNSARYPVTSYLPVKNAIRFDGVTNVFIESAKPSGAEGFIDQQMQVTKEQIKRAPRLN